MPFPPSRARQLARGVTSFSAAYAGRVSVAPPGGLPGAQLCGCDQGRSNSVRAGTLLASGEGPGPVCCCTAVQPVSARLVLLVRQRHDAG